jgi:hypothetical protein
MAMLKSKPEEKQIVRKWVLKDRSSRGRKMSR